MFKSEIYVQRRKKLQQQMKSGLLLFLGNEESPMNYPGNPYHFRQDSSFLYYWGLDEPGLAAVLDVDSGREMIFGYDFTVEDIVWMGPQATLKERARRAGVKEALPIQKLDEIIINAVKQGRDIHYLPQYRPDNVIKIEKLLGIHPRLVNHYTSLKFIKAVIAQRSIKSSEEIKEIEFAVNVAYEMHTYAMKNVKPGKSEREIAGAVAGIANSLGNGLSFPIIFSIHGETLHNHYHGNIMKKGDMAVNDSGAESLRHYASDITRTIPVGGKFTTQQKEIYEIVLRANTESIRSMKPGVKFRKIHLQAAHIIANGLKDLGFLKGNVEMIVKEGAHALFFPHGLGHMLGLDVHDMEDLGEQYIGYDEKTVRSQQFGLAYLRMAKELQPGHVMTVEPGIYFIPELIDLWKSQKKFAQFINYPKVEKYRRFGGIRIEDNVLVTKNGRQILGKPIPKTVKEVEALMH
ncbi:MAG: Xaa-Pro aminopeptidase [Caldithrix sp. RBG_13_44_9]|nr:MAG: Xaa-Pro aminopeptidase [Caldithrix sp. RBG_13_44_9]